MQIASVNKARSLAFIDIDELNKLGKVRLADIVPAIVQRYQFLSSPSATEDFDLADKGVAFGSGRMGDIVIDQFKIYSGVLFAETLSSTDDSCKVIYDLLHWGSEELGITYQEGMIRHWAFVSQITFFSDIPLLRSVSKPFANLAQKTGAKVSEIFREDITYHPLNLVVGHDPASRKNGIASFLIQPKANVPFAENKFFSEAPLPTDVHIQFLRELEEDTKSSK